MYSKHRSVYPIFGQTVQYFHTPVSQLSSWNTHLNFQIKKKV